MKECTNATNLQLYMYMQSISISVKHASVEIYGQTTLPTLSVQAKNPEQNSLRT